ncbi:NAD(P)/FAD-dependent oxidoreductase [Candidatus Atelocyanobacterium thalassae]|uniref:Demethylphylloquinone reductase NdbB n=1 Tax=cyanobacterium endosymbiont of Braarudosphaera bigelowii TaxID=1285375 RepID=A0ABM7U5I2_9CHRO|nr:NAD(P)/FAD-dependent oxidoreductase [Candidatus Atelocyanobacterium thalassa]BDA39993.1 demethylphylloquinone reductase NdbB [cyanobacterium endosymbiont of Braarudosphaera bigelowii]
MKKEVLRICIVGGGFGGLYTALRLSKLFLEEDECPTITLIDKNNYFLFTPLLYELITDEIEEWEITPSFRKLLVRTNILFKQGLVTNIDTKKQIIQLENKNNLHYDKLVLAMGVGPSLDSCNGAKQNSIPFRTLNDVHRIKEHLLSLERKQTEKIHIAIVGGGSSGVEIACKLADLLGEKARIRLIEKNKNILKDYSSFSQNVAGKALKSRHIFVNLKTEVTQVSNKNLCLLHKDKSKTIPVDLVIWTIGTKSLEIVNKLLLPKNSRGSLVINSKLQVINHPEIFAIGDIAEYQNNSDNKLYPTAQTAFQQADYCAWNIWASITKNCLLNFSYQPLGEMIVLGNNNAALFSFGIKLDGPLAYIARRLVYLYRLPTQKHQLIVGINSIVKPLFKILSY